MLLTGPGTIFMNLGTSATCTPAQATTQAALPTAVPTTANSTSGGGWAQAW